MKTATITYHNAHNYGALLQAYALQQAQLKLLIDNVIINYNPEKNRVYYKIKGNTLKIFVVNIFRFVETAKSFLPIQRRFRKFETFTRRRLRMTRKYRSLKDLKSDPPEADWYIAGSDQLWNVSVYLRKEFFLDFGDSSIKRASFAVSMGSYQVSEEYRKVMRDLLERFNSISVREVEAKIFIEELLEKKDCVSLNFDPVFLLSVEEWSEFAKRKEIGSKYILCFPMSGHPLLQKALNKLKQLTGYRTVIITTEVFARIKGDIDIKDASPEEFIYLLKNAEYVLTTSFHGTAFCTMFHKKFYSFLGGTAPTRITGILKRLGLEDRIAQSLVDITTDEIDYENVNRRVEREQELAKEYLLSLIYHGGSS